jgi:hypothetical protein
MFKENHHIILINLTNFQNSETSVKLGYKELIIFVRYNHVTLCSTMTNLTYESVRSTVHFFHKNVSWIRSFQLVEHYLMKSKI